MLHLTHGMDEKALIDRARAGDREKFGELVSRHRDAVYRFDARWLADPDQALDVAQDVFVRAFNGLKGYRGDSRFRTWLFSITLNAMRSAARRRRRLGEIRLDTGAEFADLRTPADARAARADAFARAAGELVAGVLDATKTRRGSTRAGRLWRWLRERFF
ncbi:MAG: sigma-70 family RNA polymerase sigma factor [Gemmatimonadota bacterium]|nr:MAG: sigma-70 family RNA polymerase sigma factor [Gemmatimonadota bacterium]